MFGNTRRVTDAIAEGLERHGRVEVVEVGQAILPVPHDRDLLVIGGPTLGQVIAAATAGCA
jgi:flavorubredoxin